MKCDNCSCTKFYTKDYEHNYSIRGKEIKFIAPRRFCEECDNLIYDAELDNAAGQIAIETYNKQYGIVKEKIKELREQYDLSLELFSKIIGCAKKTLISYEKGTAIPNDNYVIIINSLVAKPDTIDTLIEANKQQFTGREYEKIKSKIMKFIGNNSKQIYDVEDYNPTEYNGYTKLNFDKVINMILYFAKNGILKTKLMKEMFYADFLNYKNTGMSITGLEYAKITHGPVPDDKDKILNECILNEYIKEEIEYKNDYEYHNIIGLKDFNENIFDVEELEILEKVKHFFKDFKSKEIADFSHEERGYIETKFSKNISYDYAFDINRII